MVENQAYYFAADLPQLPIVIIQTRILLELWSRDPLYIADITAGGKEGLQESYSRLVARGEPLEIPYIHIQTDDSKNPRISFSDGRHRTRFLIDSCGALQLPVTTDEIGVEYFTARNYARLPTAEENHTMLVRNRNQQALSLFHWAASVVEEEEQLPPTRENIQRALSDIYAEREYYETIIPLAEMKDYFKPFPQIREPFNWQAASAVEKLGPRSP